jgi:hypothetical protein
MPDLLTPEQILALAPDASSASAAKGLATAHKWSALGRDERAAWGECQGSGKDPYRTQVDLREPAFRCSCPSRKFPCKHGLGLLLLLSSAPAAFEASAPPAWVAEWLAKRDQGARPRAAAEPAGDAPPKRSSAPTRANAREAKVAAGAAELGRWLRDLVRQGLADAPSRPASYWSAAAARMVDAQAPGLARMVRELASAAASGEGWQSRLLERMALIHLLLEAYGRIESLPPPTQADIRTAIGWNQSQDELLAGTGLRDRWLVLGQRTEEEDNLRAQRTWLWGETCARPALLLSFAMFNQPLDRSLVPGTANDAELVYYPSNYPLRALVQQRHAPPASFEQLPGFPTLAAATEAYAAGLAAQPWIERFPFVVHQVVPERAGERWLLRDRAGAVVQLAPGFAHGWRLLALSGGHPLTLFGEWDGLALLPLSIWAEEGFHSL